MIPLRVSIALLCVAAAAPLAAAAVDVPDGFAVTSVSIAPAGALAGALDRLPNGRLALFDGVELAEIDPLTGSKVLTLHTPPSAVYASFVRTDPTGTYALFGETSNHEIWRVPLAGGPATLVATLPYSYACWFRAPGRAVIAHGDASFQSTRIVELDVDTGATDVLADVPGPSGPVAFDDEGNLYYGTNDPSFPAPPHQQTVLRFSADAVLSALGPTHLTDTQATVFAAGFTAISSFAFDGEGDLLVGDSIDGVVTEIGPNGTSKGALAVESHGSFPSVGPLAFVPGTAPGAQFAPYQPEEAGTLYALSTDFLTFNDLNRITPRRAVASASPPGPIAAGPFSFGIDHGPDGGFGLLFVALSPLPAELPVPHAGTTFAIGFDPATLLGSAPILLDTGGALSIAANHPGGPATLVVQAALFDPGLGAVGTTTPLVLTFR
ncbi:MAG: hypothetical protein ACF8XB_13100 [Planctomycetota bacterium JB042]